MSEVLEVVQIQKVLRSFAAERDWEQFHNPKNLAMALAGEAGELLAEFQWLSPEQSASPTDEQLNRINEEIADVMIYTLRLADKLDIDLSKAIKDKISKNSIKYPKELSKGRADKSTSFS
tara:strand:- start:959 stop:1318 length:360 start_codon:yes stop_codon:yes gene_type:complete